MTTTASTPASFSLWRLIVASLWQHRRLHTAVALGVAAGTAVLTGALLVGDSMRGSLKRLTLERLGAIDEVLLADRMFRQDLADEIAAQPEFREHFAQAAPALLLAGSLENPQTKQAVRTSIFGCHERFWSFAAEASHSGDENTAPASDEWSRFRTLGVNDVVLNAPLAEALGVQVGDDVLVRMIRRSEIPSESALGRKNDDHLLKTRRMGVKAIVPAAGLGRLSLKPDQRVPKNAFVPLPAVQNTLDQPGLVNAVLISSQNTQSGLNERLAAHQRLQAALRPTLADYGLTLEGYATDEQNVPQYYQLASDRMLLPQRVLQAIEPAWKDTTTARQQVAVYLANTLSRVDPQTNEPGAGVPYSTIAALDLTEQPPLGPFVTPSGEPIAPLAEDEIVLNDWTAEDLQAAPGDLIRVTFFEPESTHGAVEETTVELRLKAICRLAGPAADRHLTPELKGVTDEQSMADWDPPFPYEQNRIREKDETYWDEHRATPKAFVSAATGRKLWSSRFGDVTSVRVVAPDLSRDELSARLLEQISPEGLGLRLLPVKLQGLAAAAGTTPFQFLFLGFSFFIVASAVMLVVLLFRLAVEQRTAEIGIGVAVGLPNSLVRRWFFGEGAIVATAGALLGVVLGIGYAWLMLAGLQTWWLEAIRTPFLTLEVPPLTLVVGGLSGVVLALLAIGWSLRRLAQIPVRRLLAKGGLAASTPLGTRSPWPSRVALAAALCAVAAVAAASRLQGEAQAGAFFSAGALLLTAGLAWMRGRLRAAPDNARLTGRGALVRLALRNGARNPGRSLLTMGLMAAATFLIVAISAFRLDPPQSLQARDSGTGGFTLVAESEPLLFDLGTAAGRAELGLGEEEEALLAQATIFGLRVRAGDDASCLNLYQTMQPRVLGLPDEMLARGGFAWGGVDRERLRAAPAEQAGYENWRVLFPSPPSTSAENIEVPIVLDANTATYSLHKKLGDTLELAAWDGQRIAARIVGLLKNSIFQGDVLMREADFTRLYPEQTGRQFFVCETKPENIEPVSQALIRGLAAKGMEVERTDRRLTEFMAVQNTYLSTFQSLGGLGLLLGTLGMATVQLRNVLERRAELALLRAVGFGRRRLSRLVTLENLALLLGGLGIGAGAAVVAVIPHLLSGGAGIPWGSLGITLGAVLITGFAASTLATTRVLKAPLIAALRGD